MITTDLTCDAPGAPGWTYEQSGVPHLVWRWPRLRRRTAAERSAEVWLLERGIYAVTVALVMASGWLWIVSR